MLQDQAIGNYLLVGICLWGFPARRFELRGPFAGWVVRPEGPRAKILPPSATGKLDVRALAAASARRVTGGGV
jgi:hypothetical protein